MERSESARRSIGVRIALGAFKLFLTLAVTGFILGRVGMGIDQLSALDLGDLRPRWGLAFASCVLLMAGYFTSAAIWARMITDLGGPRLPLRAAAEVYFVANVGRYLPGKLWQIAGLAVLGRQRGVPIAVSTAAAVLGQAVALAGAAFVGALAFLSLDGAVGRASVLLMAALAVTLAVALVPALNQRAIGVWFRLARAGEFEVRPRASTTLRWLLLYTLNWVMYASAFVVLVKSFELPGGWIMLASSFAAAYVLGYAVLFAPAGIGVREGFLVLFLAPAMGAPAASMIAVVARLWTTAAELVPAGGFWAAGLMRKGRAGP